MTAVHQRAGDASPVLKANTSLGHKWCCMKTVPRPEKFRVVLKLVDKDLDTLLVSLFGVVVNGGNLSCFGLVHLLERP